jgi:hypothetical protein
MSEETLRKLALRVRNWGAQDEIGTLNYITPGKIAEACRLVAAGKVFALGIPLQRQGPQSGTRARFNPIHTMFRDGGDQPKGAAAVAEMQGAIPNMDLTPGEISCLDEQAADCAIDRRYAFFFVAPPLPVTNAVGTPINPYAMK